MEILKVVFKISRGAGNLLLLRCCVWFTFILLRFIKYSITQEWLHQDTQQKVNTGLLTREEGMNLGEPTWPVRDCRMLGRWLRGASSHFGRSPYELTANGNQWETTGTAWLFHVSQVLCDSDCLLIKPAESCWATWVIQLTSTLATGYSSHYWSSSVLELYQVRR